MNLQIDSQKLEQIQVYLNCIYTDILMLQDGSWEPDDDSIECSMEMIQGIASELLLGLEDTRDE